MRDEQVPPRPETDAEWAVHWAFYQLTVKERDYERTVNDQLRRELAGLRAAVRK